jgi:hypothetical protein
LDELDDDKIAYNRRIADIKLDETFQEIENSSGNLKQFIESLNLFKEFEEKLNKYINDINYQYGISQNAIKDKDYYDDLNDKLNELHSYSLQYYKSVNSSYQKTKELILESICEINELIENCSNITFQTMANKYQEIKNNSNSIDEINQKEDNSELPIENSETIDKKNYTIKSKMQNYITDNEIKLDIIFEDGEIKKPKIVGKFINKNRPKKFEIDIFSEFGDDSKFGTKITSEVNNISLSVDFIFDICSNKASFNAKTDFDEYIIKKSTYNITSSREFGEFAGMSFSFRSRSKNEEENRLEGEKEEEIISAKKNESNFTYNF